MERPLKKWTEFTGLTRYNPDGNHVNPVNPVYLSLVRLGVGTAPGAAGCGMRA
jgi:hypothetical protein